MKLMLAILVALFLTGASCENKPDQKPQDPIFVGTPVNVPIREKCTVTVPQEPRWQVEVVAPSAAPFDKSKALMAENEQRRDYINQLRAAAKKCE